MMNSYLDVNLGLLQPDDDSNIWGVQVKNGVDKEVNLANLPLISVGKVD